MGIYIIQYFVQKGVNQSDETYDGFESLLCTKVIEDIMSLYSFPTKSKEDDIHIGFHLMMKHLYRGGALLQSIIDPVSEETDSNQRKYLPEMKVFLSLRGDQLYRMLSYNALLLTTYRDDIDTNIEKNDVFTLDMTMDERMVYYINYIDHLWEKEIELLRFVSNYKNYENMMGKELAVVVLMKGIRETIEIYYREDTPIRKEIVQKYNLVLHKINDFLDSIYKDTQVMFFQIKPI